MNSLNLMDAHVLLMKSDDGNDHSRRAQEIVMELLPGLRTIGDQAVQSGDLVSSLVLLPADASDISSGLKRIFQGWLTSGLGTVMRTSDGMVHSRFIPFSLQEGIHLDPAVGFYLDGQENNVLLVGERGSAVNESFISSINTRLQNYYTLPTGQVDRSGIETYIRQRFEKDFPPLAYHNPVHIEDVYEAALRIATAEGVGPDEIELIRVAALFHDAGFIHTLDKHEECGADMAAGVMPCFGFTQAQISIVCQMIMATRVPQDPKSLLDRIICDADLDYLGRPDFYPIGNRLFQELRETGKVQDERTWNMIQKKFLGAHRYHTEFGRNHREPQKQERLKEIEALLA